MYTAESRGGRGIGIFILRHEDFTSQPPYEESSRMGLLAKNVRGARPKEAGGHYIDVSKSHGDVYSGFLWPADSRPIPSHGWIFPAIVAGSGAKPTKPNNSRMTFSGASGITQNGGTVMPMQRVGGDPQRQMSIRGQYQPSAQNKTTAMPAESVGMMLPVQGQDMHADARYAPIGYASPMDPFGRGPLWPKMAKGLYGLALPATNEPFQVNLLYQADPRLTAVNWGDEPDMGSLVCDVDDDGAVDPDRMARLQSAFRVIARSDRRANSLALQLTFSENEDCEGGLVIDHFAGNVLGRLSYLNGGPLDVGDVSDPHWQADDDDGNPINPVHLSLQSLFKHKTKRDMDGPLNHEGYWKGAQSAPIRTHVHFEWDPVTRTHRWAGDGWMYVPNEPTGGPPTQPPNNPPPVIEPPPVVEPPQGPPPQGPNPQNPNPPPAASGGETQVPWDPEGGQKNKDAGAGGNGNPWGPKSPPPPDGGGAKPPQAGAGGGVIPVGPLPPGSDHPKWKNPDGSDPFWPWGWAPGKNGSEEKQKKREQKKRDRDRRRAERKKKHTKGKVVGVVFHEPPEHKLEKNNNNPLDGWRKLFRGLKNPGALFQGRIAGTPPPNVFSPNIRPGGPTPAPGGPTPVSSPVSPGYTTTPPGRGPMPTQLLPGPQFPPALVNELMMPSWIARGQSMSYTARDLRYEHFPASADILEHDQKTPISGHMQAYYAHGGAVGSNVGLRPAHTPVYTQKPRTGRWWQGSSNGGWWITTPETDLADQNTDFAPPGVTQSRTYFGVAPRVYFGAGLPDLAQGGMRKGYRWGADSSGNLSFDRMSALGIATPVIELGADGVVNLLERGSGAGQGAKALFYCANGTTVGLVAPDAAATNPEFVLPDADGSPGDVLTTDGSGNLSFAAGGGGGLQTLYATAAAASTTGTAAPEVLQTYTIPAGTLATNGDAVIVRAWGSFAANANPKTVTLLWGGATPIATNDITATPNGVSWVIEAKVMRRSATLGSAGTTSMVGAAPQSCVSLQVNAVWAGGIAVAIYGTDNGTAGDIICDGFEVEEAPA